VHEPVQRSVGLVMYWMFRTKPAATLSKRKHKENPFYWSRRITITYRVGKSWWEVIVETAQAEAIFKGICEMKMKQLP